MSSLHATQQQAAYWVQWLIQHYPHLVVSMRNTSHHFSAEHLNPWHLEGDVWSHTMMVLQSYVFSNKQDPCVGLTALLHDIGKPKAAQALRHRKRIVFQGHESLSAWMTWALVQDHHLALTRTQQLRIFSLVALHGSLYSGWFSDDPDVKATQLLRAFSGMGNGFWQQLLAQVAHDIHGQVTLKANNKTALLTLVNLPEHSPTESQQAARIPLVCLVGLPGSGKTTFRKHYPGYTVISRDDILLQITQTSDYRLAWERQEQQQLSPHIDQRMMQQFNYAINTSQPILLDLTNLTRKSRRRWLSKLPGCYQPQAIIMVISESELWQRNHKRGKNRLPIDVLQQMLLNFEHPLCDEFERIDYVVDGVLYPLTHDAFNDACVI